jgi:hypothetical protein
MVFCAIQLTVPFVFLIQYDGEDQDVHVDVSWWWS